MTSPLPADLRKAFPEFSDNPGLISDLLKSGSFQRTRANELIVEQGQTDNNVFFVLSGKARAIIYSRGGDEIWIDDLESGDIFGELAALKNEPRANYIKAKTSLSLLRLSAQTFLDLIANHGDFALWLSRVLAGRVKKTTTRMYELSALSATGRVLAELLREANYCPNEDRDHVEINPSPSMTELAKRVHSSRETVSRTVNALERHGLITREGKRMILVAPEALWDGRTEPNLVE